MEGSEVIIDKRAQEAVPWYVTADLNQYTEANKKRFYEAVELAARVQDFIDYDGPDRTGYAERYALGLGISPQSLYRYMKNVLEANAWALKLEKEDGKSRDYFRALALCRKPKETGTFPSLTDEQKAIIENIWFDKRFAANLGTIEMLYERFELEAERREWEEYPQISAQAGSYTFEEGVELEIYSSKSSYYDWAKIRFTSQFRPKLSLKKKDPATIQLGYDGTLEDVFTGFVSGNYDGGTYANEVALKDEMLLMEETIINDTFLDTTPQELISYFLAQAGLSKMKLSSKTYPTRKMLPIRRQTAVQAINAVNAAWGLRVPFFFSGGVFYWDEKPEQKKVYTFERGVNILNLRRAGGVWELETVSAPFIKHSHKINLIHPQVSGEVEVSKVVSKTNDSGFIRTYIYF